MSVAFPSAEYAEAFLRLNSEHASASLDELRTRWTAIAPPEGMEKLSELDCANAVRDVNQRLRDELSDPWQMSGVAAIILLVFAVVAFASMVTGKVRGPVADGRVAVVLALTTIACVGFMLRINAARLLLAAIQFMAAAAATVVGIGALLRLWRTTEPWKITLGAAALWWFAFTFTASSTRRLCSKWGRLERWFGSGSAGGRAK